MFCLMFFLLFVDLDAGLVGGDGRNDCFAVSRLLGLDGVFRDLQAKEPSSSKSQGHRHFGRLKGVVKIMSWSKHVKTIERGSPKGHIIPVSTTRWAF